MDASRPEGAAPPLATVPQPGPAPDVRMAATGEDSEWFRRLPPAVQQEYRARWARAAQLGVARVEKRKRSYASGALRGAIVFFIVHMMFGYGGWLGVGVVTLIGGGVGCAWTHMDAGPMRSALVSAPLYTGAWCLFPPKNGKGVILIFFAWLMVMALSYAAGQAREFRQGDGEE